MYRVLIIFMRKTAIRYVAYRLHAVRLNKDTHVHEGWLVFGKTIWKVFACLPKLHENIDTNL